MAELIKKILVPVDGSKASQKALEYATWVAGKLGAQITLLNVVDADKLKLTYEAMDQFLPEWEDKIKGTDDIKRYSPFFEEQLSCMMEDPLCKRGNNVLKEMAKFAEGKGIKPKTMLKLGRVVDTIVQVAEDDKSDLIVVGKTGLTGIKRLAMGHVAEDVARYSHCRVTVVPLE
jgi:nucleotide-binding universal stress UspA family protein